MNCLKSGCNTICKMASSDKSIKRYQFLKTKLRSLWGGFYNVRYLNVFQRPNNGSVYQYSYNKWINPTSPLLFQESKFSDLFEYASKSKYLSASMLAVDITEVSSSIDTYKENYPFTVNKL